ncbi:22267_t:CDS:2, partial [Entrophospora sp. SA101]
YDAINEKPLQGVVIIDYEGDIEELTNSILQQSGGEVGGDNAPVVQTRFQQTMIPC